MAGALRQLTARPGAAARGAAARRGGLLQFAPALALALFLAPVAAGLLGTALPAFDYLPALGGTAFGLAAWRALLAWPGLGDSLALTLTSGLPATILSFAIVVGFLAACHGTAPLRLVQRLLAPLLAVPHVALAIGFAFLIAPSGWILRLLSPWATGWQVPPDVALVQDPHGLALAAGLVVKETPFLLMMTLAALERGDARERLAVARSLGYGPVTAWLKTVLPAVYPQIRLPIYAVLAFSLSVVDMALILAPATPPPLAVLVFRWFGDPDLTLRFAAAAGAVLQLAVVIGCIAGWHGAERLVAALGRRWARAGGRGGPGIAARRLWGGLLLLLQATAGLSLLALALWSVTRRWRYPDALPSEWTLAAWWRQDDALLWAGSTTLTVGLAATLLALALVLACLENEQRNGLTAGSRALWLLYLPLLVPQVSFLFGVQVLTVRLGIEATWLAVVWTHLLFVLPYVFLALADPFRALDERYARSAFCLGASPDRVFWRVKMPMLLRPVLVAFAVGFAVSVAQYLPTVFAGGGRHPTLTTEAVALLGGADRRVIGVYAFLQALLPLAVFAVALTLPTRGAARRAGGRQR